MCPKSGSILAFSGYGSVSHESFVCAAGHSSRGCDAGAGDHHDDFDTKRLYAGERFHGVMALLAVDLTTASAAHSSLRTDGDIECHRVLCVSNPHGCLSSCRHFQGVPEPVAAPPSGLVRPCPESLVPCLCRLSRMRCGRLASCGGTTPSCWRLLQWRCEPSREAVCAATTIPVSKCINEIRQQRLRCTAAATHILWGPSWRTPLSNMRTVDLAPPKSRAAGTAVAGLLRREWLDRAAVALPTAALRSASISLGFPLALIRLSLTKCAVACRRSGGQRPLPWRAGRACSGAATGLRPTPRPLLTRC